MIRKLKSKSIIFQNQNKKDNICLILPNCCLNTLWNNKEVVRDELWNLQEYDKESELYYPTTFYGIYFEKAILELAQDLDNEEGWKNINNFVTKVNRQISLLNKDVDNPKIMHRIEALMLNSRVIIDEQKDIFDCIKLLAIHKQTLQNYIHFFPEKELPITNIIYEDDWTIKIQNNDLVGNIDEIPILKFPTKTRKNYLSDNLLLYNNSRPWNTLAQQTLISDGFKLLNKDYEKPYDAPLDFSVLKHCNGHFIEFEGSPWFMNIMEWLQKFFGNNSIMISWLKSWDEVNNNLWQALYLKDENEVKHYGKELEDWTNKLINSEEFRNSLLHQELSKIMGSNLFSELSRNCFEEIREMYNYRGFVAEQIEGWTGSLIQSFLSIDRNSKNNTFGDISESMGEIFLMSLDIISVGINYYTSLSIVRKTDECLNRLEDVLYQSNLNTSNKNQNKI